MARPRRAIITLGMRVRRIALAGGLTILVVVSVSYARIVLPGQQEEAASVQAISAPISQGEIEAPDPLPSPSLAEPTATLSELTTPTPTPSATPKAKATPTPSRTTAKVAPTKATTARTSASKAPSSRPVATGNCSKPLSGGSLNRPQTHALHQVLCTQFPGVSSFGGYRSGGDPQFHGRGLAIDAMVSNSALGQQIANWARANAGTYGITQVIWAQRIWTTQRSGEGWRAMGDRGSYTANHFDHVHITLG